MGYSRPAGDVHISSSWQDHRNRNPPSAEPGTDYASAYGTVLVAAGNGEIVDVKHDTGGGTGRYITIDMDDGQRTRYLHLSEIWFGPGQRVNQGDAVGLTGASANGSDWGVGAHVHVTLFPSHSYDFDNTLDFEAYVGQEPGVTIGKDKAMWLIWYGDNAPEQGVLVSPTAQVTVENLQDYNLLKRIICSNQGLDNPEWFNYTEKVMINEYLVKLAQATAANAG